MKFSPRCLLKFQHVKTQLIFSAGYFMMKAETRTRISEARNDANGQAAAETA